MKPVYIGLVALGLVAGVWAIIAFMCHPTPTPESASEPAAQVVAPDLIGSLRSRNHTIHVYVGRFTIEDSDGQVLANLVTEDEFAKLLPGLFGDFRQMYAEGRLIADNRTHGKLPSGWSYSAPRTTLQGVKITPDP